IVAYNAEHQTVFLLSPNLSGAEVVPHIHWHMFLQVVHDYFASQGFIHWLTPSFVTSAGVDANIDFFYAQGVRTGRQYRLPTSPEFELKKALVQGVEQIYEIKKCYRDDDTTPIHRSEFTMLEWYRAYANIDEVEKDVLSLANYLIEAFALPYDSFEKFPQYTMAQLFKTYLQFELTPQTSSEDLQKLLERDGLDWSASDDWNDLFFRVYVDRIEPHLAALGAIVVRGFPAQQRSLARLTPEGWADRFEFYWNGVEIANAYHEENNPESIEMIIATEISRREKAGRAAISKDSAFAEMMKSGLPPSAGIALGLDRLFMCLMGKTDLDI
ncbi:MAG: hypothetical protein IT287_08575, partial [Bdellovibrionaceae bacterium]|nr:hypothetical protein [Pseudobdellovibrionaceae bacterium]